jgi:hypothetical protein
MAQKPETVAINGKRQEAPQANAEKGLAMLRSGTAPTSVRNSQGRRPRLKTNARLLWQFRNVRYSTMSARIFAVDQASRLRNGQRTPLRPSVLAPRIVTSPSLAGRVARGAITRSVTGIQARNLLLANLRLIRGILSTSHWPNENNRYGRPKLLIFSG